jgi:hypothetical protein
VAGSCVVGGGHNRGIHGQYPFFRQWLAGLKHVFYTGFSSVLHRFEGCRGVPPGGTPRQRLKPGTPAARVGGQDVWR